MKTIDRIANAVSNQSVTEGHPPVLVSGEMELYGNECEAEVHRSIENQLCLQVRLFESAMTQPGFARKRKRMLLEAQNTYWGALLTMMAMQKPDPERFAPIHAELRRLRATLTAFKM